MWASKLIQTQAKQSTSRSVVNILRRYLGLVHCLPFSPQGKFVQPMQGTAVLQVANTRYASLVKLFWRCPSGRMPTSCPAPAQQTHPNTGTTKHLKISVKHLKTLSGICSGAGAAHACGHHAVKVPCKTVLALPIRANAYLPQPIKLI